MKAMILAAGLGTRLMPHSTVLPKPAMPFLNIPLIYYSMHLLERLQYSELVVNTHHLPEKLLTALRSFPEMNFKLHISHEAGQILGSGGGAGFARTLLEGDGEFALMNGDELLFPSRASVLPRMLEQHRAQSALATILVMRHPGVGKDFGGVWTSPDGHVRGFGKTKPAELADVTPFHFTGLQILSDRIFDYIPTGESNIFYDVMIKALAAGEKVLAFEDRSVWYETGNPHDYLQATCTCLELMQKGQESPWLKENFMHFWPQFDTRPSLWEGHDCHHHLGDLAQYPALLGDQVRIHGSVELQGFTVIGEGTSIGENCRLQNCVIGPRLRIPPETVITDTLYFAPVLS